jgi:hypothetical protein
MPLLLLFPVAAPAAAVTGDSRTYFQSRETVNNTKLLGAYEYLDLAVQNIGPETITFHTGGWLRYDITGEDFDKKSSTDLQYAYLSFKSKTDNTVVNLGRVMVFEGVAAERVDGVYARTDLMGGFGISGFGGRPTATGAEQLQNETIYGARFSHRLSDLYKIGVSYLEEDKDGVVSRKEKGVDLWMHPLSKVELLGRSGYNAVTRGWMENAYYLFLGPFEKLRLNTEASQISYKDYFSSATSAAFKFQAGVLDPNEQARILGEEASYAVTDRMLVSADYKIYRYEIAGHAEYFGGKVKYSLSGAGLGGSLHRMEGSTSNLRYSEYRVYGYKKFGKIDLALDVIDVSYDSPLNGVKDAYSASLAVLYDSKAEWKAGADIEYSHNPDFDKDVRAFVKFLYRFGAGSKGGG